MRGLELARRFYLDAVRPILRRRFPQFEHAAALIGTGSEVLGYDDDTSSDHHWGPRVQLFVRDARGARAVERALAWELPTSFGGYPTNFGPPEPGGSRLLVAVEHGPVAHRVEVLELAAYLRGMIGAHPLESFRAVDWLLTPAERLLEVTAGDVFSDPIGDLTRVRERLAWYPHDVWLLVMAGHWRRVAQLEHLVGRAGACGDDLGSRLVAASLVRDLMRLSLLQRRRYPPYAKWLGTAYARLDAPERASLGHALRASRWRVREEALCRALGLVARAHNALGVTNAVDPAVREFHGRGFRVLLADRLVDALRAAITDPDVRAIDHLAGAVDSVSDSTDVLTRPALWTRLRPLYDRRQSETGERDGM